MFVVALSFSHLNLIVCSGIEVNLGGTWIVHNANKSLAIYGEVPGNVHTALYRNDTIMDPYFRFNDVQYRWIAYDNWTYTRSFEGLNSLCYFILTSFDEGELLPIWYHKDLRSPVFLLDHNRG